MNACCRLIRHTGKAFALDKSQIRGAERAETGKDQAELRCADAEPTGKCGCVLHAADGGNPSAVLVGVVGTAECEGGISAVKFSSLNCSPENDVVAAPPVVAALVGVGLEGP